VRFEPGDTKTVSLVPIAGKRIIQGGNGLASGPVDSSKFAEITSVISAKGFYNTPDTLTSKATILPCQMDRKAYADMFGPTTGDLVRLGDTELWIRVERDFTVYGDECKFGGGKVLRDGMGQASGRSDHECLDLVITNALIIDYTGIYKVHRYLTKRICLPCIRPILESKGATWSALEKRGIPTSWKACIQISWLARIPM